MYPPLQESYGRITFLATALLVPLASCRVVDRPSSADTDTVPDTAVMAAGEVPVTTSSLVTSATGFKTPESVRYDPAADVYFVANINGNPSNKDNNGFISRMRAENATVDSMMFIAGGRGGVTLHAPKGSVIVGDTLWVTDIDAVRGFNKNTGLAVASVDLAPMGAIFLNDIAATPDGSLYITDTGIRFGADGSMSHPGPDRIFSVAPDRTVSVAVQGETLGRPNGIAWHNVNAQFVLAGFGSPSISMWKPGEAAPTTVATGAGSFDGLDVLADGRILVSSWADSSVSVVSGSGVTRMISGISAPADFGVDTKRGRLAIPRFQDNRVELWTIPAR